MTTKLVVFTPLLVFAGWAAYHLASPGPQPFFLRWIDLSMAFTLALVATLLLKNALLGKKDDDDQERGNP